MAKHCVSPTGKLGYRKFSFVRFLLFGFWLGPLGTFVFWPTLITFTLFLDKLGIGIYPWGVTQWCWGCYWVAQDPDASGESS